MLFWSVKDQLTWFFPRLKIKLFRLRLPEASSHFIFFMVASKLPSPPFQTVEISHHFQPQEKIRKAFPESFDRVSIFHEFSRRFFSREIFESASVCEFEIFVDDSNEFTLSGFERKLNHHESFMYAFSISRKAETAHSPTRLRLVYVAVWKFEKDFFSAVKIISERNFLFVCWVCVVTSKPPYPSNWIKLHRSGKINTPSRIIAKRKKEELQK